MITRKKGLGRGLEALLGSANTSAEAPLSNQSVPLAQLIPGRYQPRRHIDPESLQELADSIRAQGMIQPIAVRPISGDVKSAGEGRFEIIAGERRYRAAQSLGLSEVPVVVHEVDDQAALAMALIENLQRKDLNAMEEAQGIGRLIEEFGLTHEQAAQAVGRSRSATSNLLRLLQLPQAVQDAIRAGEIDAGHARVLVGLQPAHQRALLETIKAEGLSVREVESRARFLGPAPGLIQTDALLDEAKGPRGGRNQPSSKTSPDWLGMQSQLADLLGLSVRLIQKKRGGEIQIRFSSNEEFDGFFERISRRPGSNP